MLIHHGLAFEEHRKRQPQRWWCRRDDPVDVALDPATCHREPELSSVGSSIVQLEARDAQPTHGQVLQHMADLEHPQDAAFDAPAGIDRCAGVRVLQRPFAGHA